MAPPPMEVDVAGVGNVAKQWKTGADRLSALRFGEFAAAAGSGSAVAAALHSISAPAERSCGDIGNRLASLADAANEFLESVLRHDSFPVRHDPGDR